MADLAAPTPDVTPASAPWPRPRQAWYAVAIFATALMVNFLDRGILNLLVEPIKRDLHLSDLQISLLMGFAFACFYVILGLPIARLADSRSRRAIVGTGIAIFSVMTALCGLALAVATVARSANTGVAAGVAGWALVMLAGQASKGRFTAAIGDSALVLPYLAFAAICVAIVLFATRTPRGTT